MEEETGNWHQFSCIHSTMVDGFIFTVYNASHRLKYSENVNPDSAIDIIFPSNGSYFIVFHGRLVHCGGPSVNNENGTVKRSGRMFSYLRVPEHNARFNPTIPRRTSSRLKGYTIKLKEGKIDRSSFGMMKCSNMKHTRQCIELPENKTNLSKMCNDIRPVIGNMNLDGWEIYEGINITSTKFQNFNEELEVLFSKSNWSGISSTKRKIYTLSSVDNISNKVIELRKLYNAFEEMHVKRLQKIPYLSEVELVNKVILANFGALQEQEPHRDFFSQKKK